MNNINHDDFIEGYTDQLSVEAGREIGLCVSTSTAKYSVEVARIGAEREVVWSSNTLAGAHHPTPENASSYGCGWPVELKIPVGAEWRSGYYSVILKTEGSNTSGEASFVVRSARPGKDTSILLQLTTNTDNAYNSWGGYTLYNGPGGPDDPARRVSFDRPFAGFAEDGRYLFDLSGDFTASLDGGAISKELGETLAEKGAPITRWASVELTKRGRYWRIFDAGRLLAIKNIGDRYEIYDAFSVWESCWHQWQHHFVAFAERAGYRIDFAVNGDLEFHPEILPHYRLVLSVGHDEYWSWPMRDSLESFIENGGNVAFFSGNSVFWQVRSEDDGRALACYKVPELDPVYSTNDRRFLTTVWPSRLIGRPENHLTGVSFAYGGYHRLFDQFLDTDGDYTIHRGNHWVFEGTGLRRGDKLGGKNRIIGYECDGCDLEYRDGLPYPTGQDGTPESLEVLATAPAGLSDADDSLAILTNAIYGENSGKMLPHPGAAVMGIYTRGGTVFTAGCTDWPYGLRGRDRQVERITRNVLDRLSN
jgi:hypothetical protein